MTQLEVEAQNLVNEAGSCGSDVEVNDENKYEQLLEDKKDRRCGEPLFNFLERQVKTQMRGALGQPLCNIPSSVLNKMVSKDVALNLRKYKMNAGTNAKTPAKRSKSRGAQDDLDSPDVKSRRGKSNDDNSGSLAVQIRKQLRDLDSGIADRTSLLKMLVIRCDEADQQFNRVKHGLNHGQLDQVERIVNEMQSQNGGTLNDIQTELAEGHDLLVLVGQVANLINKELNRVKQQAQRTQLETSFKNVRDSSKGAASPLRNGRQRDQSLGKVQPAQDDSEQVSQMRRKLTEANIEIERMRDEMMGLVRQIDTKDDRMRQLERRINESPPRAVQQPGPSEFEVQLRNENDSLRHENDGLRNENRSMKDKVISLSNELDRVSRAKPQVDPAMQSENLRLRHELQEAKRENEYLNQEVHGLRNQTDMQNSRQKSEWADIYATMKRDSDDLKKEIRHLNFENEKLLKQLELSRTVGAQNAGGNLSDKETAKRLKKRELECQALWETLKDMQVQRGMFDTRQMMELLGRRALDTKARRKLAI